MLELLGGGVLGSLIGGIFRIVPEVIKYFDKKNDRIHELAMFDKQCELEKTRNQNKLNEIQAERDKAVDVGVLGAFKAAIDQQATMAKAAGGWVASLNATVRPVMTYYLLALYGLTKIVCMIIAYQESQEVLQIIKNSWSADDMALLCGVVNYWILDRTLGKRGLA